MVLDNLTRRGAAMFIVVGVLAVGGAGALVLVLLPDIQAAWRKHRRGRRDD